MVKAGWTSRVTLVITPSAPKLTTAPGNTAGSFWRDRLMTSPAAETNSRAATTVDKLPFLSPEPCVAVLQDPATEMCGREARLGGAKLLSWRRGNNGP